MNDKNTSANAAKRHFLRKSPQKYCFFLNYANFFCIYENIFVILQSHFAKDHKTNFNTNKNTIL